MTNSFKFKLDRAKFPMVYVDVIDAYIHWLPLSKIQFEYFLCAVPDSQFGENWYGEILQLNPRISPGIVRTDNYWKALLSGLLPEEVQRFARWCGDEYIIPSLDDWFTAYKWLKSQPPEPPDIVDQMGLLQDRVRTLLRRIDSESAKAFKEAGYERTLADQMLMRLGMLEWVECTGQTARWGGMGQLNPRFHGFLFRPDNGQPSHPVNPETDRLHYYGARLLRRVG